MSKAMRYLDRGGAWGLVLIGCLHNFVGAPASFEGISEDLFWFLSAGLALWYAGAANIVRQYAPSRASIYACVAVNLTLLCFVAASGFHSGEMARPVGILLIALAGIETGFALFQAYSSSVSERTHSA